MDRREFLICAPLPALGAVALSPSALVMRKRKPGVDYAKACETIGYHEQIVIDNSTGRELAWPDGKPMSVKEVDCVDGWALVLLPLEDCHDYIGTCEEGYIDLHSRKMVVKGSFSLRTVPA